MIASFRRLIFRLDNIKKVADRKESQEIALNKGTNLYPDETPTTA